MFFHLLYIHLFRPFLKYNPLTSPLPSHVSPRKLCTHAASSISKLMRLYKRTYGLRQICNIAVYMVHSACTIHLLNLPEKTAKRDIIHGAKHLEEIAEDWLCARRTLSILSVLARKWKINLPEEASAVFTRTDAKYGFFSTADVPSPKADQVVQTPPSAVASPARVPQRPETNSDTVISQNQLQQKLFSYLPDYPATIPNSHANMNASQHQFPSSQPQIYNDAQLPPRSEAVGSMNTSSDPLITPMTHSQNHWNIPSSRSILTNSNDLSRSDSAVISETSATSPATRQLSPSTMFGGVDALVASQDWWLRDQANLAVGFENWMVAGGNGDMNGGTSNINMNMNGSSTDINPMMRIGPGPYLPSNGNNGAVVDVFSDDDWTTYT